MEKIYVYDNAIVTIKTPTDKQLIRIKQATEEFAAKAIKGGYLNGNNHSSNTIRKQ